MKPNDVIETAQNLEKIAANNRKMEEYIQIRKFVCKVSSDI